MCWTSLQKAEYNKEIVYLIINLVAKALPSVSGYTLFSHCMDETVANQLHFTPYTSIHVNISNAFNWNRHILIHKPLELFNSFEKKQFMSFA